jgi:hypothetical protein
MAEDKSPDAQAGGGFLQNLAEQIKSPLNAAKAATGISRTTMILMGIHAAIQSGIIVLSIRSGGTRLQGLIRALRAVDTAIMEYIAAPEE